MAEVIKMPGTVRSVNGIKPDANANVELEVKPLFLIKRFSYAITLDDYRKWENGDMGKWKLRKTVAEWGLPENFPENIPGYLYRGIIMHDPFDPQTDGRPWGGYFENSSDGSFFVVEVGDKYGTSTTGSDTKPSVGDYLILWFFYTKQGYDFNF